jgi:hypothetical protein
VDKLDVYNMERLQVESESLDLRMDISPNQRMSSSPLLPKTALPAGQSPTRGATPTSWRSSRLSYYPDDGCCGTAGPDVESDSEPLELVGPGGGRSSTSTLLIFCYPGPSTNVIGKNKGGCWVCGSLEHRKPSAQSGTKPLPIPAGRLRERQLKEIQ